MQRSERILISLILAIFMGLGFFLGVSGLFGRFERAQATKVRILVANPSLFPDSFRSELETTLNIHFEVEVASDNDSFVEKAPSVDLLWGPRDLILKTELHLKDFRTDPRLQELLSSTLSPDFYDPQVTAGALLPVLWNLPIVRLRPGKQAEDWKDLFKLPGRIDWHQVTLADLIPTWPKDAKVLNAAKPDWYLYPLSEDQGAWANRGELWFPKGQIKPLVLCMSFVENDRLPNSLKESLVEAWLLPVRIAKLAVLTKSSSANVLTEELLPPSQRASALRLIGVSHLARP